MPKDQQAIEVQGVVEESFPNGEFLVKITTEGFVDKEGEPLRVHARVGGKMRKYFIRILPGDVVTVELSPYDLSRGRITYREK